MRGAYGEMRMDDPDIDGYYIVEWNYKLWKNKTLLSMRIQVRWCTKQGSGIQRVKKKLVYINIRRRR